MSSVARVNATDPQNKIFRKLKNINRSVFIIYLFAFILRILIAGAFLDRDDGPVFLATGNDIINEGTNIYFEGSLQNKFNYFPLAYLAILPGLLLYYLIGFENIYFLRIMLKLPLLICDLLVAYLLSLRSAEKLDPLLIKNYKKDNWNVKQITRVELLILFNPIFIYASAVKGQFDIVPALFMILAWRYYLEDKFELSGILAGISILFKQYGVLLTFFIGLSLLKKDYRKSFRFLLGHLISTVPILLLAAYLNFDGLREHAILYHLNRAPSGISLTSLVYWPVVSSVKYFSQSHVALFYGGMILAIFKLALIYFLLLLGNRLWNSENNNQDVLRYILYGFIIFYLLNNVLWEQYFVVLIVLWVEFKNEKREIIHEQSLYWNFATIPIVIAYRTPTTTPDDLINILGNNWIQIVWFTGVILHFVIMMVLYILKKPMFTSRRVKFLYQMVVILSPIHYYFTVNFFELINSYVMPYDPPV